MYVIDIFYVLVDVLSQKTDLDSCLEECGLGANKQFTILKVVWILCIKLILFLHKSLGYCIHISK